MAAVTIPEIKNIDELLLPIIKSNSKIINYTTKPLTATGENYGSVLLVLEVKIKNEDNTEESLNMVAKLCPTNQWLKRMFASYVTFKKEIGFYMKLLPELINFQKQYNVPEDNLLNFFPEYLNARISLNPNSETVDDNAILLLENLKLKDYKLLNRLEGSNYEETLLVLKSLARFHAVPLAYKIKNPNDFKTKMMPLLNRVSIGQEMMDVARDRFKEIIYRYVDLTESELKRFLDRMEEGYLFQKYYKSGNEKYATIIHCDFWLNNTMILFENDKPVRNKMLDFQVNTYGSPVTDLLFYLYTSVELNTIKDHYEDFLKFYHSEFIKCLQELDCNTSEYTFDSLLNEIKIFGPLEAWHILTMFKAVFTLSDEDKKFEDITMDDIFSDHNITDIYKNRVKFTVKNFFSKNWF